MRLNRYLARCGLGSRRSVEGLIAAGRVRVNGEVRAVLASRVDPGADCVEVDGVAARLPSPHHLVFNKPAGCDVTRGDPHAARTIFDLLPPDLPEAIHAVGRLDRPTTGLLLLTNDGDLSFRLSHPRHEIEKAYLAIGPAPPTTAQLEALRRGVELEDGTARAERVESIPDVAALEPCGLPPEIAGAAIALVIHQGRKRVVRRMCEAAGYKIAHLHRTRVGPVELGGLPCGDWRELAAEELEALEEAGKGERT